MSKHPSYHFSGLISKSDVKLDQAPDFIKSFRQAESRVLDDIQQLKEMVATYEKEKKHHHAMMTVFNIRGKEEALRTFQHICNNALQNAQLPIERIKS